MKKLIIFTGLAFILGLTLGLLFNKAPQAAQPTEFQSCFETCQKTTSLPAENCIAVCSRK